ncbi:MAG: hypothetical protein IKY44_01890 [Clostridia bacterium]|nr:hypothetical protein [Clostridia bacterium]
MEKSEYEFIQGKAIQLMYFSVSDKNDELEVVLKVYSSGRSFKLVFYNVSRLFIQNLSIPMIISGFEIICNKEKGWDKDSMYSVHDFEDDKLHFFCADFKIT